MLGVIVPNRIFRIADALVASGCLRFGSFKLKSGITSPYYIDLTWVLSSPKEFDCIVDIVAEEIRQIMASREIDRLASMELKGALFLPTIASRLNLPCLIVRKEEKEYGLIGRVAGGNVERGERLLFFDDVISDGTSKLEGTKFLERLGAHIEAVMVVIDREQGGKENLEKLGYRFYPLTTISELVQSLKQTSYLAKEQADVILDFIKRHKK